MPGEIPESLRQVGPVSFKNGTLEVEEMSTYKEAVGPLHYRCFQTRHPNRDVFGCVSVMIPGDKYIYKRECA